MSGAHTDTDPEAARIQLALLRAATPARRLRLALSLSQSVIALSRAAGRGRGLDASTGPVAAAELRFVELCYGPELAAAVRQRLGAARL